MTSKSQQINNEQLDVLAVHLSTPLKAYTMNTYRVYEQYQKQPQDHLTRSEALKQYQQLKREDPNALIELEELDCGHWRINAHKTKEEKDAFVKRRWSEMTARFTSI